MVNAVQQMFQAWGPGYGLTTLRLGENAASQGCNDLLVTLQQAGQASCTLELLDTLAKRTNSTAFGYLGFILLPATLFAGLLKPVTKFLSETQPGTREYEWLSQIVPNCDSLLVKNVYKLHIHLGTVFQVASAVSALALLYLGQVVYATTCLAILSFGYLERHHWIPLSISVAYHSVAPWISDLSLLIYGGWFLKLLASLELVSNINRGWFLKLLASLELASNISRPSHRNRVPFANATHTSHLPNLDIFKQIFTEDLQLEVNRDHVWIEAFPTYDNRAIEQFEALCNTYDWQNNEQTLATELENDPRWENFKEQIQYDTLEEDAKQRERIAYAKNSLKTLVESVKNKTIQTSDVLNYEILNNYLACLGTLLPKASPDIRRQILTALAVEGGNYCGAGIYYQLATAAIRLQLNDPNASVPLKQRILLLLEEERMRVMEAFHQAVDEINKGAHFWAGGAQDIHSMNQIVKWLGGSFGLPDLGADQDPTTDDSLLNKAISSLIVGVYPEDLWQGLKESRRPVKNPIDPIRGYTVERIMEAIFVDLGNSLLPTIDVLDWATTWISDKENKTWVPPGKTDTESFVDSVGDGSMFDSTGLRFKRSFIKAMLVDMGILKIKN